MYFSLRIEAKRSMIPFASAFFFDQLEPQSEYLYANIIVADQSARANELNTFQSFRPDSRCDLNINLFTACLTSTYIGHFSKGCVVKIPHFSIVFSRGL